MTGPVILDTGPLVAYLHRDDGHHAWAKKQFAAMPVPMVTCEAVLSEACFLLRDLRGGTDAVFELLESGAVAVAFRLQEQRAALRPLLARYADVPMSLADACLVRMAEIHPRATVFTIDGDFRIYRKHGREAIPLLMPGEK
jgi:predicted nucleic acid-binding protein